ncbi:signal transduction histidine kinase [Microbacterium trichothecenolyticum]|uniref:sensor histidine kinase n=1 Tax=Microbacterium trichothecenolyticum TaxID=69370 RepID=UPI0028634F92|nr:sensor histidine kinase [Microbacterium trichothecenolyticum]MDR7114012.1 signal transduction histidine kinase [Microbacterium trichothecenolyticum]
MSQLSASPSADADGDPALRPTRSWRALVGSIRVGQSVITAALLIIGAVRAAGDGTPVPWVVAVSVVFAGWYFGGLLLSERTRDRGVAAGWLVGLALIWIGAVAISPEFVWLAFPLWLLAGFVLRMRWAIPFSIGVLAVVIAAPLVHSGATTYANVIGPLVGGVFALGISRGYLELVRDGRERSRLISSLVSAHDEMAQLQDELARAQRDAGVVAERTRLSRDIHDTIAQSLTSIGMLAGGAAPTAPEPSARTFTQIGDLAREGLADTRRIVDALMPAELEGSALADALRRMLERLTDETGIRTELRVDDTVPALPVVVEVALLRTAQSALANTRVHAKADRVVVSLVDGGDSVRLDIVDDGVGFDAAGWERLPAGPGGGYGLRAMRERLRELGGGLDVESAPGAGAALSASVPIVAGVAR